MKKFLLLFVLSGSFLFSSCSNTENNPSGPVVTDPRLSVINASNVANENTRLSINADTVNTNFTYGSVFPYRTLSIGPHRVNIKYSSNQRSGTVTLGLDYDGDQRYTMFVYDVNQPFIGTSVNLMRVNDNRANPGSGNCKVRIAYFSTDAGTVRAELQGSSGNFTGLTNGTVSEYREFTGSSNSINIIQSNTGESLGTTSLNLQPGGFYTIMISGKLRAAMPRLDIKLISQN
ncbi:MAG TPA: DUF4397 domain-containing protein [Ignavibacteria bacterium]|nr:DUF4397 domain-containing protein [Ignavibacteria bacterium]